jgi:hypothetical protein
MDEIFRFNWLDQNEFGENKLLYVKHIILFTAFIVRYFLIKVQFYYLNEPCKRKRLSSK